MSFENLSYIVVGLVHIYIVGGSREVKGEGTIPRAWVIKKARVAMGGEGIKVMINSRRP